MNIPESVSAAMAPGSISRPEKPAGNVVEQASSINRDKILTKGKTVWLIIDTITIIITATMDAVPLLGLSSLSSLLSPSAAVAETEKMKGKIKMACHKHHHHNNNCHHFHRHTSTRYMDEKKRDRYCLICLGAGILFGSLIASIAGGIIGGLIGIIIGYIIGEIVVTFNL